MLAFGMPLHQNERPTEGTSMRTVEILSLAVALPVFALTGTASAVITEVDNPAALTGGPFEITTFSDSTSPIHFEMLGGSVVGCVLVLSDSVGDVTPSPPGG